MTAVQTQCCLAALGFYPYREIDGIWGPKSEAAAARFRQENPGKTLLEAISGLDTPEDFWDHIRHFTREEFRCHCTGRYCDGFPAQPDENLVALLEDTREALGKPAILSSGVRCEKHNADPKVGGSPSSHHVKGMAADIRVEGITPEEVARYAESIGIQRIGLYDTFVHIGSDSKKRFWLGHRGEAVGTFEKTVTLKLPVLKKGSRGDSVMALQTLLEGYGYTDRGGWGTFDNATEMALKEYQRDCEIAVDGSCGKVTWSSLLGAL